MPSTRLYFTATVEEQWQTLVGPWLREHAVTAWENPRPTVILTPSRAESFYLRSRMVEEGVPYFGLRFWTPSDARKFLRLELAPEIGAATQAELRLITRTCAERLASRGRSDNATLNSVIREPDAFLRAYDLLLGAGSDPAREGAPYGRELARELQRELEAFHVATQAGLHRLLLSRASRQKEPLLAHLLVAGFNAAHWPLWDLLKATVFAIDEAVVALSAPRFFGEEIDQLWNSSWEEVTQSEAIHPASRGSSAEITAPFAALVASYEKGERLRDPGPSHSDLSFLVTPDLASQINAIVLQALHYLRSDFCTRLGIIFPEANALALGVAEALRRLGIPLNDGTGSIAPGLFEKRCWQSWIALQEEPGVPALIAWVRACEAQGVSCGLDPALSARQLADVLDAALGESLVDDLDFLTRHLAETSTGNRNGLVADFLRARISLPQEATFAQFLALTRQALASPGWEDHLSRLQIDPPAWLLNNDAPLSRRIFLEWLKESTDSRTRTRGAEGNHFYGKVHLLIYAQAGGQTWSHLILTGQNEGVWPRVFESGAFGSRHELEALNRQARALNQLSATQGGQGVGHEVVRADRGHCLLPLERQALALRDLCAALEATSARACLTATTTEGGRSLLPSDFFNHAYQAETGRVLDEESFRHLANSTEVWCDKHAPLLTVREVRGRESSVDEMPLFSQSTLAGTRIAYAARRDSSRPFGPYEFAYAEPPARPIQLSCKRWEDAWNHPATVWFEEIVGASSWPDGTLSWPRAVGTWAHRWLAAALREWQNLRAAPAEFPVLLWATADREAAAIRVRARAAKVELYPWWGQVWAQARTVALGLAESLTPHLHERKILCEFRLPHDLMSALPGSERADFALNGRIDLLLVEPGSVPNDIAQGDLSGCACWVVDFKTGSTQTLSAKRIAEGKGLQPVLYALAIRALGATSTAISLHTVDAPLKPQVQVDAVVGVESLFRSLEKLHRDGVFGMRPDAANAYGYSPAYPMATRFVPPGILETKWALVHGSEPAPVEETE